MEMSVAWGKEHSTVSAASRSSLTMGSVKTSKKVKKEKFHKVGTRELWDRVCADFSTLTSEENKNHEFYL